MCKKYSRDQCKEWYKDHGQIIRDDLLEEFLKIHKSESCKHRGDYLRLISDHVHFRESEIPERNFSTTGNRISIKKLRRNQCDTKYDTKDLCGAELLGHRPGDSYW